MQVLGAQSDLSMNTHIYALGHLLKSRTE